MSDESKFTVASNLTVAAMLRDLIIYQTGEKPLKESEEYILDKFRSIYSLLSGEAETDK
jgi:hypothetical protein